jgi:N-acetylglutamate synthase-like GNAT family acetyltransferase
MDMLKHNLLEIKPLIDCQQYIPSLAKLWYQEIRQHWVPGSTIEQTQQELKIHSQKDKLPMAFVACYQGKAIGMACLRDNDGVKSQLTPWLGSLVVEPAYRKQRVGEVLINAVRAQAKKLNFNKLYLLAFDPTIPSWYAKLGWQDIGTDHLFGSKVQLMQVNL